jgi:nitrate reductase gamma subunit
MSDNNALYIVEIVHWVALGIMGLVYTIRLLWLFKFNAGRDRQEPGDHGATNLSPGLYSMANVVMPWAMESTRNGKGFVFYLSFVIFHMGVAAGIFLAIFGSLTPEIFQDQNVANAMMVILGAAFMVGFIRILRRLVKPVLRLISTPDDYFSVLVLTVWFLTGVLAQAYLVGHLTDVAYMVVFLGATSFFLIYVPFSKISHYLYYPFTRYYLGKTLGHRGSLRPQRG